MRIFLSSGIPKSVKDKLEQVQGVLKEQLGNSNIRWEKPKKMHLTVLFIGSVEENRIEDLERIVAKRLENVEPFKLGLEKVDAFPNNKRPRVILVEIKDPAEAYQSLQQNVAEALNTAGFSFSPPKPPHITIGRVRSGSVDFPHIGFNKELRFKVTSVVIKESILRPTGAVHEPISFCKLGN